MLRNPLHTNVESIQHEGLSGSEREATKNDHSDANGARSIDGEGQAFVADSMLPAKVWRLCRRPALTQDYDWKGEKS